MAIFCRYRQVLRYHSLYELYSFIKRAAKTRLLPILINPHVITFLRIVLLTYLRHNFINFLFFFRFSDKIYISNIISFRVI